MDSKLLVEIIVAAITLALALSAAAIAYGILKQQVDGLRRDMDRHLDKEPDMRDRLTRVETCVGEIKDDVKDIKRAVQT